MLLSPSHLRIFAIRMAIEPTLRGSSLARADNQELPAARFFEATASLRSRRVNARLSRSGPKMPNLRDGTGPLHLSVWEKIAKNRQHASDCFLAAFWPLPAANSHGTVIPLKTQLVYGVRVARRDKLEWHRPHFAT